MTNKHTNRKKQATGKTFILALGMMAALGTGLVTTSIISTNTAFAHAENKGGKHENRAHKKGKHKRPTDAQIKERASRFVDRISGEINATDEQREKIHNLAMVFSKEVRPRLHQIF